MWQLCPEGKIAWNDLKENGLVHAQKSLCLCLESNSLLIYLIVENVFVCVCVCVCVKQ